MGLKCVTDMEGNQRDLFKNPSIVVEFNIFWVSPWLKRTKRPIGGQRN